MRALVRVGNEKLTRTVRHKVSKSGLARILEGSHGLLVRMMVEMGQSGSGGNAWKKRDGVGRRIHS